jgi:hypothetical protein
MSSVRLWSQYIRRAATANPDEEKTYLLIYVGNCPDWWQGISGGSTVLFRAGNRFDAVCKMLEIVGENLEQVLANYGDFEETDEIERALRAEEFLGAVAHDFLRLEEFVPRYF